MRKIRDANEYVVSRSTTHVHCLWFFSGAYLFFVFLANSARNNEKSKEILGVRRQFTHIKIIWARKLWLLAGCTCSMVLTFTRTPHIQCKQMSANVYGVYLVWWAYSYYALHKVCLYGPFSHRMSDLPLCQVWITASHCRTHVIYACAINISSLHTIYLLHCCFSFFFFTTKTEMDHTSR